MPADVGGKDWKLARPFHGPYRIVSTTPTNAEVQLIERPSEPTLFVALSRVRKCYPEIPTNVSWTGRKRKIRRKNSSKRVQKSDSSGENLPVRQGPVTRSMTRASRNPSDN